MSEIREILDGLKDAQGVKGCAIITTDGIMVQSALGPQFQEDVIAGLTSFLVTTTRRSLQESDFGAFTRFTMNCTHGKLVLYDLGEASLVLVTDQFARLDDCMAAAETAAQKLRDVVRMQS